MSVNYQKCRVCGEVLKLDDFYNNVKFENGHDTTCRVCRKLKNRKAYHKRKTSGKVVEEPSFKIGMTNSGYTLEQIQSVSKELLRSTKGVSKTDRNILDYVECRCGEEVKQCYPCYLNSLRDKFSVKVKPYTTDNQGNKLGVIQ